MKTILLQITQGEENYLPLLKPFLSGRANVRISNIRPDAGLEVVMRAQERGTSLIATTCQKTLQLILGWHGEKLPSLDDYMGSIIEYKGCDFLILPPLDHLITVPYGRHLYERYFKKFLHPEAWFPLPQFTWELYDPSRSGAIIDFLSSATFISCDIETVRDDPNRSISCIGFTGVIIGSTLDSIRVATFVVPFTNLSNVAFARTALDLPNPKVFQNGKYDIAYLLRYNAPTRNYAFDTLSLFHAWYSELPKDLGFLVGYLLRKWVFWKDESKTSDLMEYYRYNAKDAFTTAMCLIVLMMEMPPWALENFKMKFPLMFPCIYAEAKGLKVDREELKKIKDQLDADYEAHMKSLRVMVNNPFYNPGSYQQTARLFEILGSGDIKTTGKIQQDKVASRHPLNKRIITHIQKYREDRKLSGTYTDEEKLWNERAYFSLNPDGTDTSRLASKESHFWCGWQIQNIPRTKSDKATKREIKIKNMFVADAGFFFGEGDYTQAEARDTAYLSGDEKLIAAVDDPTKDFHSLNAADFFGLKYKDICKSTLDPVTGLWDHERLLLDIIDIAKRTNHGSNYNMGAQVMLDTMGIENVLRAKRLLNLPYSYSLLDVTQYLLDKYAKTYHVVKGPWYEKCKSDVSGSNMLVGPTGWTRYCFGNPLKNKRDLNRYVAHPPQSLNAQTLNKAYMKVFYEVWMPNQNDFRLGPQIHDSIHFQYRIGRKDLALKVKEKMEMDIPVKDTFGKVRVLRVPVDLKGEHVRWGSLKKIAA